MMYLNVTEGITGIVVNKKFSEVKVSDAFYCLLDMLKTGLREREIKMLSLMMEYPDRVWSTSSEGDVEYFCKEMECKKSLIYTTKSTLVEEEILWYDSATGSMGLTDKWKIFAKGILRHDEVEFAVCFRLNKGNEEKKNG
jgi:hypothetical protein